MDILLRDIIKFLDKEIINIKGDIGNKQIKYLKAANEVDEYTLDWINPIKENKQEITEISKAKALLVDVSIIFSDKIKQQKKILIYVESPKICLAKVGFEFFVKKLPFAIHETAEISPNAKIGKNVFIGAGCVIGDCVIGDRTRIYPNITIYNNTKIGNDVIIHSGAVVGVDGLGCIRKDDSSLLEFPQLGGVIIGNNVLIGANTHIACGSLSDTIIGDGTKINGMCFIGSNCILGNNIWITGSTMLAGSVKVEDNVTIYSKAIVREHRKIGKAATIGMGAVVTKNVPANETWIGNPAKKMLVKKKQNLIKMVKENIIFRILIILLMLKVFLPIVTENLPPILTSFYLIAGGLLGAMILFHIRIFFSRTFIYLYIFVCLYVFYMLTGKYDINFSWFFREILPILLAISIYTYFILVKDYKGLAMVIILTLIFISITTITTIIGLTKYPLATRDLGGELQAKGLFSLIKFYEKMGIASYGFFTGLSFTTPVIVYQIKKNKGRKKYLFIILLLIIYIGIIKAQMTAPLLIGTIGIIIGIGGTNKIRTSIIFILLLIILFIIIPKSYISNVIANIANLIGGKTLQTHLFDLSYTIDQGVMMGNTHFSRRADRIPFLLEEFSKSPIIGGGESTGHVFWLDLLSMYGLVGIIPWILILMNQIKLNLKILSTNYKFYYLISMLLYISLGFIKGMGGRQMMIIVFVIVPGIYHLQYLKKTQVHYKGKIIF